ncbi:MAG: methylated-DNA--[protein]-cysteine S-methyltransferase [Lachnospiraceae bacterium]|jgi:methylated-DNA-[protein]-cysteine S-methyltransferase|nr:methylated-DNA--[protein]-cysteine S-methyltransferase [Lachnospiraceae bacterium]MCI1727657.1 methylated-DNA--[protein]-cysteine S-methyltransferase [Lachnospiraceae bacterium]
MDRKNAPDGRTVYTGHYESPVGGITIASDGTALTGLWFDAQKYFGDTLGEKPEEKQLPVFGETKKWLDLYFAGRVPDFLPPLSVHSSPFRESVWKILLTIPYGHTMTYGEIASALAREKKISRMSAQAVGGAVGHNPISLIIPCHRVIGSDGSLTGYAGGLEKKSWLLRHEGIAFRE